MRAAARRSAKLQQAHAAAGRRISAAARAEREASASACGGRAADQRGGKAVREASASACDHASSIPHKAAGCRFHFRGHASQRCVRQARSAKLPQAHAAAKRRISAAARRSAKLPQAHAAAGRRMRAAARRSAKLQQAHAAAGRRISAAARAEREASASACGGRAADQRGGKAVREASASACDHASSIPHKAAGCRFHFRGHASQRCVRQARSAKLPQAHAAAGRRQSGGSARRLGGARSFSKRMRRLGGGSARRQSGARSFSKRMRRLGGGSAWRQSGARSFRKRMRSRLLDSPQSGRMPLPLQGPRLSTLRPPSSEREASASACGGRAAAKRRISAAAGRSAKLQQAHAAAKRRISAAAKRCAKLQQAHAAAGRRISAAARRRIRGGGKGGARSFSKRMRRQCGGSARQQSGARSFSKRMRSRLLDSPQSGRMPLPLQGPRLSTLRPPSSEREASASACGGWAADQRGGKAEREASASACGGRAAAKRRISAAARRMRSRLLDSPQSGRMPLPLQGPRLSTLRPPSSEREASASACGGRAADQRGGKAEREASASACGGKAADQRGGKAEREASASACGGWAADERGGKAEREASASACDHASSIPHKAAGCRFHFRGHASQRCVRQARSAKLPQAHAITPPRFPTKRQNAALPHPPQAHLSFPPFLFRRAPLRVRGGAVAGPRRSRGAAVRPLAAVPNPARAGWTPPPPAAPPRPGLRATAAS
jgi:hypothetical protein